MSEINIGDIIAQKRKQKGVTQTELANYMGVSKASVSKWERGQSYPDVTFLPILASYFDISVDSLLGYSPQLTNEGIRALYNELKAEFSTKPFDEVKQRCESAVKKYSSCYPLLLHMSVIYINHCMLAGDEAKEEATLEEAISLCVYIKEGSCDASVCAKANYLQAIANMMLNRPGEVIDLLAEGQAAFDDGGAALLSMAYRMKGDAEKAKEVIVAGAYSSLLALQGMLISLLPLLDHSSERYADAEAKALGLANLFDMDHLHFNTAAQLYLSLAHGCVDAGDAEKTILYLRHYCDVCARQDFPIKLAINGFFKEAEKIILSDLALGVDAPTNDEAICSNIVAAVEHPAFNKALGNDRRYTGMVDALKHALGVV